MQILNLWISADGRDKEEKRFAAGKSELEYYRDDYDHLIHHKVLSIDGQSATIADSIYQMMRANQ